MDADKLPLGELREYLSSVSDRELLEIILSTWKCRAPEETAENLMNSHTTFADALTAETTDEKTATALRLIPALSSAFIQSGGSNCLNSTGSAMEHFRQQLSAFPTEHFSAAAVNVRFRGVITMHPSSGTFSAVPVSCREIVSFALSSGHDIMFISHNHPEGSVTPSENDISATKIISSALSPLGIVLADHIIVGRNSAVSMRELCGDGPFGCDVPRGYKLDPNRL